ncbi:hypothetical protein PROFUN_09570 [Planoprotostelium fungivorum]|uniref:Uncharacterized protein n=1 Tax=Planoprotostelium fungivorum TaxID=1890364 RepID=A0A2P6NGT8_9EUKA|nr:hypothetical protein PROFUN_09570 [Planoprotostelium fungivorum]
MLFTLEDPSFISTGAATEQMFSTALTTYYWAQYQRFPESSTKPATVWAWNFMFWIATLCLRVTQFWGSWCIIQIILFEKSITMPGKYFGSPFGHRRAHCILLWAMPESLTGSTKPTEGHITQPTAAHLV